MRTIVLILALTSAALAAQIHDGNVFNIDPFQIALFGGSIPSVSVEVSWTANPIGEGVLIYVVYIDYGSPYQSVRSEDCVNGICKIWMPDIGFGDHQVWVTAKNQFGESLPSEVVSFSCRKTGTTYQCRNT